MKKDNIEELYRNIKGYEKQPPEELWDNIEANLQPNKKRRGLIFWLGSAAAVLILLFSYVFYSGSTLHQNPKNKFTTTESATDKDSTDQKTKSLVENVNQKKDAEYEQDNTAPSQLKKSKNQTSKSRTILTHNQPILTVKTDNRAEVTNINTTRKSTVAGKTNISEEKQGVADIKQRDLYKQIAMNNDISGQQNIQQDASKNDTLAESEKSNLKDIAEEETEEKTIEKKSSAKPSWLIDVSGGFANTTSESVIQSAAVQTSAQNNLVYNLKLGYALTERLVVKTGIGNNVLGQEVGNISFVSSENILNAGASQNLVNNDNFILLVSDESLESFNNDFATASGADINQGSFSQQFNYLQIPLEFSYNLIKKEKFNIGLGFGGNINFLTDNTAFINEENIGENLNVNSTLLGATLLSNFSYDLNKNINIFVEPNYNYFQKPVDNANQDFRNMQFRFLFGIQYRLK